MQIKIEGGERHQRLEILKRIARMFDRDDITYSINNEAITIHTVTDLYATMGPRR